MYFIRFLDLKKIPQTQTYHIELELNYRQNAVPTPKVQHPSHANA